MGKNIIFTFIFSLTIFSAFSQSNQGGKSVVSDPATVTYKRKSAPSAAEISDQNANASKQTTTPVPDLKSTTPLTKPTVKLDTIIRLGGKKIICTIQKVNQSSVQYTKPNESTIQEILRKEIEKIIYRNGRKEVYNKPVLTMIDQSQWEAVLVTENEGDVDGLYKRGVVKANAASDSRSPKAAKTSATIRMQKKAANMGALIVYITHSEMKGGYGEIPGWELEGIAYSDVPPADTASVNKAVRALLERNRARVAGAKKKNN
jgi:hypothetical protein